MRTPIEDFYFGDEKKRTPSIARMCSNVVSLWRIDWTDFARALFEDGEYKLELSPRHGDGGN